MNKSVYRALSIIMALCVFLGLMPMTAYAENDEWNHIENIEMIQFSPEAEIEFNVNNNINKFYSGGAEIDTTKYFYNQLTKNQKAIYDQINNAGFVQQVTIDMTGLSFTGTGTSTSTAKSAAANNAQQDVILALTALCEDNPMFFWSSGFGMSYSGSSTLSNGTYTYKLSRLIVTINFDTNHYSSFADIEEKYNAVVEKVATIPVYGISRHEKVKSIHDYIVNNMEYDDTISLANIYDVYGAFINGICVCEGYAEAFKVLCDREGIPCITVIGTGNGGGHKWNMVLMEDGEWYTMDATWNDQSSTIYYSFFITGSNTRSPYFGRPTTPDSSVHIPDGISFTAAQTALSYPILSTDTYGVGALSYNAGDVHFDTARGVVMVGKEVSSYYNSIVNYSSYGFTRTTSGSGTTTSTLTVSDGATTKTYLVAMRGDINASNVVDATDYTVISNVSSTTSKIDEGTAKFYAGDMNQDGAIDGFDAIMLELYQNGDYRYQ